MRAIVCEAYGPPGRLLLKEVEAPRPGPGEVLVQVNASGANFADVLMVAGSYQVRPPLPFVPGLEFAGTVLEAGSGSLFRPGERVMGAPAWGAFAEQIAVPESRVFAVPEGMGDETAAGFVVAYGTAGHALQARAALAASDTLLVTGAAWGVGLAAIHIARRLGARVIAAVGSPAKAQAALEEGADTAVDTSGAAWSAELKRLTGGRGVDVLLDTVGGEVFAQALRATAPLARVLVVGFASGEIPRIPAEYLLVKNITVHGIGFGGAMASMPALARSTLEALAQLHAVQPFAARCGARYALKDTAAALQAIAARSAVGKQLIRVAG